MEIVKKATVFSLQNCSDPLWEILFDWEKLLKYKAEAEDLKFFWNH